MYNPNLPDSKITAQASARQQSALNSNKSIWVSANAGTGKTTVLIKRLLLLLIKDPACLPQEIIALTFSKTAAKEMLNKLLENTEELSKLSSTELTKNLTELLERPPAKIEIETAKNLYNTIIDNAPEISTLHSFCHNLLAKFPLEAGILPLFLVMEDTQSTQLLQQAQQNILISLAEKNNRDFNLITTEISENSLAKIFGALLENKKYLKRVLLQNSNVGDYLKYLRKKLGIKAADISRLMEIYLPEKSTEKQLLGLISWLESGTKTDLKLAVKINTFLNIPDSQKNTGWQKYKSIFFTVGSTPIVNLVTKKLAESSPENLEILVLEQARVVEQEALRKATKTYLNTAAIVNVGAEIIAEYSALKSKNNLLDYDDLINKTAALLEEKDISSWVRFKIDSKIKHLLLDEGQDTNQEEWAIVKSITEEFFTGSGQHENTNRTLFAVGDIKQSIYRFRGAEPKIFSQIWADMQKWDIGQNNIERVDLETSFRTSQTILNVVDSVFSSDDLRKNLTNENKRIKHISAYPQRFGLVELWPVIKTEKTAEKIIPWELPKLTAPEHNSKWQVANRVAKTIQTLINSNQILASTNKFIDTKDIIVLIRSRACLPTLLERFNHYQIPTIVNSKDDVLEHPIVKDLMAFAKFLSNKNDDLNLVHTLKSPIFSWDHQQIFDLHISKKPNQPLWHALFSLQTPATEILATLLNRVGYCSVYELLTYAIQLTNAKGNFMRHFGDIRSSASTQVIVGIIDAFLEEAFKHPNQLDSFIYNLSQNGFKLPSNSSVTDAVQIMTIHAAKGLEAPIIFMPDTTTAFGSSLGKEPFLWADDLFIAKTNQKEASNLQLDLQAQEKARLKQDELRLLYVALTRAKERLYIAGEGNAKENECWYSLISSIAIPANGWVENAGDLILTAGKKPELGEQRNEPDNAEIVLPAWALEPVKTTAIKNLTTKASSESYVEGSVGEEARTRGTNIHKLLEILPKINIDNLPKNFAPEEILIAQNTITEFPEIFTKNSRAEVAVAVAGENLNGIIDRLIVEEHIVKIIDFKTDIKAPSNSKIPAAYIKQLKKYADCIKQIYPKHEIKCAILWVQENRLDWLD